MKRLLSVFFLLCGLLLTSAAQQKTVTGMVTSSEDNLGIPGVTVLIKGTTIGVVTDVDGNYSIQASPGQILVFRFTGQKTQEVTVGAANTIDIVMQPDLLNLEEVVVVAYGVQKREASTGSVGEVKSSEIQNVPETSIEKMLSGKVAGVQVTATSGQPGANTQIRIRGISSINAGSEPLYVIDGIPVMSGDQSFFTNTGNALASLNPNDVESMTILKDAAASSIYGSRAANGVILITTKSGKAGAAKMNFRASYGVEQIANDNGYRPLTAEEYLTFQRTAVINAGGNPDDPSNSKYYFPNSLLDGPITDWMKELTRTGSIYSAELSAQGGSDRTQHFFSGLYDKHEGIVYGSDFTKFSIRSNVDHQLNKKLKLGVRFNGAYSVANDVPMQSMYYVNPLFAMMMIKPFTPIRNDDGTYNLIIPENANANPRATAEYDPQWEKQYRLNTNGFLEYQIIKGLTAKTANSIELTDGEGVRYWSPEANYGETLGYLQTSRTKYVLLTTSNTLNFDKEFGSHNLSIVGGQEASKFDYNEYYIVSPNVDPNIPFPNTATSDDDDADYYETAYTIMSFFGVARYNYDNKYYLQASLRTDGSSRFGSKNRWGTFWSVGASWNIHKEHFMDNVEFINMLKLRGSYGISGNFNIGNYAQYGLYGAGQYNGNSVMVPTQPSNPDIGWENNTGYNAGLDFALFDRITGSFDVYSRKTLDMLLAYPLSRTSGFSSITTNIGSIKNEGIEFMLDGTLITGNNFEWSAGFNVAHNNSTILDLGKDEQFIPGNNRLVHKVGEHLYSFYLYDYAGVNPANGDAMWYNENGELTNNYAQARRIIAGTPEPKLTGGINTKLAAYGVTLDVNLEYKWGNLVSIEENRYANSDGYSWPNTGANTQLDYWTTPGQIARNPKPIANNTTSSNGYRSTRWLYDGSYLRLKNITLSYNLPRAVVNKMKMQNLRVYASAVNLYTFHNVDFWDPERGVDGCGFGIYPMSKKIIGGIEVSF
ncbi:MAG TPA: TonB-dependent receptor [Bacteroidales bacterium]|jgi:TonB-linked SusC/RagA family outer membrane protein|nr:TonB-dependent receptor [Bacteroidales bacterium]OPZ58027.1 MAG: Vitamin B12 transporter BtuB [Bacteroidetes bacterium ADurb.BinA012]MZQ78515.1 SusC/RagA family TonB-linked outer membrane protein [Bacteroidales bacterium]HNY58538.1 TonB-dependent receptor [Bacteroidales bacterium]HOC05073.1 TonB-dependent receptor [Bacteroidales bacterium]